MSASGSPKPESKNGSPVPASAFTAVNSSPQAEEALTPEDSLKRKRVSSASSHKTTPRLKKKVKSGEAWKPPFDLESWEGLAQIDSVSRAENGELAVSLIWNDGHTSLLEASIVNVKMPQAVIQFYEKALVLEGDSMEEELAARSDADSIPEVMQSDASSDEDFSEPVVTKAAPPKKRAPPPSASASPEVSKPQPSPAKGKARTKPKPKETYWEIEGIVGERMRGNKKQYRVRWVGFSAKHDSWVPEEHSLEDCPEAVEEYLDREAKKRAAQESEVSEEISD